MCFVVFIRCTLKKKETNWLFNVKFVVLSKICSFGYSHRFGLFFRLLKFEIAFTFISFISFQTQSIVYHFGWKPGRHRHTKCRLNTIKRFIELNLYCVFLKEYGPNACRVKQRLHHQLTRNEYQ